DAIMTQQQAMQEADADYVQEMSLYVVMKDFEQESCLILMFWAIAIIGLKLYRNRAENGLLQRPLLSIAEGMNVLPQDARDFARPLQALPPHEREYLLPRALLAALQRFGST